jgi:ribosome-associated protein
MRLDRPVIQVTRTLFIQEKDIEEEFVRASGPGGQNVNKVATAVQLRFDAVGAESLPPEVRERLIQLAGRRATDEGVVIIEARRFRTQERNRKDALERLINLIRKAAKKPKPRRRTRPSVASKKRRLETKRRRGQKKRLRRPVGSAQDG